MVSIYIVALIERLVLKLNQGKVALKAPFPHCATPIHTALKKDNKEITTANGPESFLSRGAKNNAMKEVRGKKAMSSAKRAILILAAHLDRPG
jgi:hypothetical protein